MPAEIVIPSGDTVARAAGLLQAGSLVAFPTETVYGLGGDATNGEAVARIFAAKERPRFNPLIVHVADVAAAGEIVELPRLARALAETFWPGPLTIVLPRRQSSPVSELVSAGLPTVALRVPDHPVAQSLLRAFGRPIAAPSANRSGHVSATSAAHVASDLGDRVAMILDGGPTAFGVESTVISLDGGEIVVLRPGAVTVGAIEGTTGRIVRRRNESGTSLTSPGQLASHYAPRTSVRINALTWQPEEAVLAFGECPDRPARALINLSPSGNLLEAAANLFAALRKLDASGAGVIAVMPVPTEGLGEAINDRLQRAAAPRV